MNLKRPGLKNHAFVCSMIHGVIATRILNVALNCFENLHVLTSHIAA